MTVTPGTPGTPESATSRPGWLELFFDLVFVVAIAKLAHHLEGDPGWHEFWEFLVLLLPAWWAWLSFTAFVNTAGGDGTRATRTRILLLAAMFCLGVVGAAVPDGLGERAPAYVLGFAGARVVLFLLWLPLARRREVEWNLTRITVFNGGSIAIFGSSLLVSEGMRPLIWLAGIGYELAVLVYAQRSQVRDYNVAHIVERVGLFVIIVLGESVVSSVNAVDATWAPGAWLIAVLGFVLFAALWWSYFEFGAATAEAELHEGENQRVRDVMGIGHFPVVAALIAMAAGLGTAILDHAHHLPTGAAITLCGGLAIYRATLAGLGMRLGIPMRRALRWALPGVVIPLAVLAAAGWLPTWAVVAALCAEAVGQTVLATRKRVRLRTALS
ncbi:low temperature requirement protein A [Acrocarpospora phusangensis]|uniref:Low temperature requirement protein A n=1 Tax=Acrocarpospora phusangensis TaxID=1070424 RepID=A0A919QJ56_9ACTN|nr:low temperature requirement protein A [Acrocarpospora phusangensis]GIH27295.1 low temperature requirement protein A [Acrocarpospora phusangensis]